VSLVVHKNSVERKKPQHELQAPLNTLSCKHLAERKEQSFNIAYGKFYIFAKARRLNHDFWVIFAVGGIDGTLRAWWFRQAQPPLWPDQHSSRMVVSTSSTTAMA
jgi:hypothetical protein